MNERYERQSFLGTTAQQAFEKCRVGVLGAGGGGSHVIQQLAHVGFRNFVVFDPDVVREVNLNRMVGATRMDASAELPKVAVAERTIRMLQPEAIVETHQARWQEMPLHLRSCDVVICCVDGFAERREAETCCRRFLIPMIDIGLDVHAVEGEPPQMAGQIILSLPGQACMACLGFLNEERLSREAAAYGAAGARPQVVWANGVLASTAVGVAVNLLSGWTGNIGSLYLSYDANSATVVPHPRLRFLDLTKPCPHFSFAEVGEPSFAEVQ